jgi:hypothetical protein
MGHSSRKEKPKKINYYFSRASPSAETRKINIYSKVGDKMRRAFLSCLECQFEDKKFNYLKINNFSSPTAGYH